MKTNKTNKTNKKDTFKLFFTMFLIFITWIILLFFVFPKISTGSELSPPSEAKIYLPEITPEEAEENNIITKRLVEPICITWEPNPPEEQIKEYRLYINDFLVWQGTENKYRLNYFYFKLNDTGQTIGGVPPNEYYMKITVLAVNVLNEPSLNDGEFDLIKILNITAPAPTMGVCTP